MMRRYIVRSFKYESPSLICYSFFGDQEGDFSLSIKSITAVRKDSDDKSTLVSEKRGIQFSDLEKGLLDKQAGEIKARVCCFQGQL